MVILNPRVSTLKVWIVFCLGNDFLIKSILTGCEGEKVIHYVPDEKSKPVIFWLEYEV